MYNQILPLLKLYAIIHKTIIMFSSLILKKVLKSFQKGSFITSENSAEIDRLSMTGAVRRGLTGKILPNGKLFIQPTARTTEYGKALSKVL